MTVAAGAVDVRARPAAGAKEETIAGVGLAEGTG
jgi:hypothetical protein